MRNGVNKKEVDLLEYWSVLIRRKWVLVTFGCAVVFFTAILTFLTTPVYKATATLLIEEETSKILSIDDTFGYQSPVVRDFRFFNTQLKLLKSRSIAERIARKLNLLYRPEFGSTGKSKGNIFDISKDLITFKWVRSKKDSNDGEAKSLLQANPYYEIAEVVRTGIEVRPIRDTKLVEVSYPSASPVLAAEIVNTLADEYIKFSLQRRSEKTQQASDFLSEQISNLQEELTAKEQELQRYGQDKDLDFLSETESTAVNEYASLYEAYTQVQINRIRAEVRFRELSNLNVEEDPLPAFLENPLIQSLKTDYMRRKNEYEEMSKKFKDNYPQMVQLKARLANMRSELYNEMKEAADYAESEYQATQKEEWSLKRSLDRQRDDVARMNSNAILYNSLKIDVENKRKLISSLSERRNETLVSAKLEGLRTSNIHIIDSAEIPKRPVSPKKRLNILLALIIGLFGGVGLCFLVEFLDNTVKGPEDVERLSGLPSLGVIPLLNSNQKKRKKKSKFGLEMKYTYGEEASNEDFGEDIKEIELINHFQPKISISEDYKTVRTSILLSYAESPPKTIVFTSALPMEGKSATVSNMAIAFSQLGERVLIVDADLRKPRLHQVFNVKRPHGLSKYLTGKVSLKDAIRKTSIENIYLLPTGPIPPNPSELLNSIKMKDMMEEVKEGYDIVLIDTPPVLAVIDCLIVSSMADATVFVIKAGKTARKPFLNAISELEKARGKIIGVVFNGLEVKKGDYYFMDYYRYYQYDYYRYGSENSRGEKRM